ncbi:hypothetical protein [Crocosphaera sp. Alani8]
MPRPVLFCDPQSGSGSASALLSLERSLLIDTDSLSAATENLQVAII